MKTLKFLILLLITSQVLAATSEEVAKSYFEAFGKHDYQTMGSLYSKNSGVVFKDPIFPDLSAAEAKAMWQMLLSQTDLKLEYQIKSAEGEVVVVSWEARYTYPDSGRQVHNIATSVLSIKDGLIELQVDDFDLCRWSKQALGKFKGMAACSVPGILRRTAKKQLKDFMELNTLEGRPSAAVSSGTSTSSNVVVREPVRSKQGPWEDLTVAEVEDVYSIYQAAKFTYPELSNPCKPSRRYVVTSGQYQFQPGDCDDNSQAPVNSIISFDRRKGAEDPSQKTIVEHFSKKFANAPAMELDAAEKANRLKKSDLLVTEHPAMIRLTELLLEGKESDLEKLVQIHNFAIWRLTHSDTYREHKDKPLTTPKYLFIEKCYKSSADQVLPEDCPKWDVYWDGKSSVRIPRLMQSGLDNCYGYAYLMGTLLRIAGIPTKIVREVEGGRSFHHWNEVFIFGQWLEVDATFDDVYDRMQYDETSIMKMSYQHFLLKREEMGKFTAHDTYVVNPE